MAAHVGTGTDFQGELVNVAFNLARCGPNRKTKKPECFTIFEGGSCGTKGKVAGYVDRVLLENVDFCVRHKGVEWIRKQWRERRKKERQVIAWARGTVRDPDAPPVRRRLGNLADWAALTFCPYVDDEFMVPTGEQARCGPTLRRRDRPGRELLSAKWVYFDSSGAYGAGIVKEEQASRYRVNDGEYAYPVRSCAQLELMATAFGGRLGW